MLLRNSLDSVDDYGVLLETTTTGAASQIGDSKRNRGILLVMCGDVQRLDIYKRVKRLQRSLVRSNASPLPLWHLSFRRIRYFPCRVTWDLPHQDLLSLSDEATES